MTVCTFDVSIINPLFYCRKLTSYQVKTRSTRVEIVLDRAGKIYTKGSEVTGQVLITASKQVNYDQIIVSLKGEGRVYPGNLVSYVRGPKCAGCHYGEVYCSKSTILLDNRNQVTRQTLPAGEHRFPFCFRLTGSRLPTSFKGSFGYISYFIGAKVVRSSSKKDIVASVEIPFVETVDINCDLLLKPVYEEKNQTVESCAVGVSVAVFLAAVLVALRMDLQSRNPIGTVGFPSLNAWLGSRPGWECVAQLVKGREQGAVRLSWKCSFAVETGVACWLLPAVGWMGAWLTQKSPFAASFAV